MSLKSIIEKCIALVTGKSAGDEQSGEENQEQNFEQNSQESFNVELGEPAVQEETFDIEEPEESFEELCEEVSQETESYNVDLGAPVQQQQETQNWSSQGSEPFVEHAAEQVHNPDFFHEEDLH